MAERRMVHKKISLSESLDSVAGISQLFFTWSIPHADDIGFLPRSPRKLKGMVFPLKEITANQVENIIKELIKAGMYTERKHGGNVMLYIETFDKHQTLRRDQQPFTYLDVELSGDKGKNWEIVLKIKENILTETPRKRDVNATESEEKRREEKRREEKRIEENIENASNDAQLSKKTSADFIRFFSEATKSIQKVKPIIDGGKDGSMIKKRLTDLKGDMSRLERMAIWYLSRTKKDKDNKGNWYSLYKNSPAIATMLSGSYFNQLLSDEKNAQSYFGENIEWVEKIYKKADVNLVSEKQSLAEKFKVNK